MFYTVDTFSHLCFAPLVSYSPAAELEAVNGATGFSQPDSTTLVDSEDKRDEEEGEEVGEDGEPNPSELRRRRLRKLETTPPPPDH